MDCCSAERSGAPDHEAELLLEDWARSGGPLPFPEDCGNGNRSRTYPLVHLRSEATSRDELLAEVAAERASKDADLVLEGSWQCPGFAYLLTLRLRKGEDAGAGVVMRGTIEWHLVHVGEAPHGMANPYGRWMATHLGSSGLEHVKGAMLDDRRLLRLAGWRVTDPLRCAEAVRAANGALVYSILGVDQYELRRCADGTRFKGVSRSFHSSPDPSTWSGVFDARVLHEQDAPPERPALRREASTGVCPICFEPHRHRTSTPCGHAFCAACICQVIRAASSDSLHHSVHPSAPCPICRELVTIVALRGADGEHVVSGAQEDGS